MKETQAMRTKYSYFWQHLEPNRPFLVKLVDKLFLTEAALKEVESYEQKFAQNSVIINQVILSDCPPPKLHDTLVVTGQGKLAKKLLQGTYCVGCVHCSFIFTTIHLFE